MNLLNRSDGITGIVYWYIVISLESRYVLRYTVIVTDILFSNASQKGKALYEYFN